MAAVAYLRHPASLDHDAGRGHPERRERILAIEAELADRGWDGLDRLEAPAAPEEALLAVHPREHLDMVRSLAEGGGGRIDSQTRVSAGSWEAALRSAGAAVEMVDRLLAGGPHRAGFCATRPPGHHAERARAMGFCLLSNAAIAARRARDAHGVERVLVVDWDVHHGNGTQEVLYEDPGALFVSIHQSPLYPLTGAASEVGAGPGQGFTVNLPVPPGAGDEVFLSHLVHVVAPLAREYRPGLVLVSSGYDAHADDPLADCAVTDGGYLALGSAIAALAGELGVPVGVLLEGGYDLDVLTRCVPLTLEALRADAPSAPDVPRHPLSEEALARLGPSTGAFRRL